jgi:arginine utilization regulatory protein
MGYPWPGNIREFINALESVLIRESPAVLAPRHFDELPLIGHLLKQRGCVGSGNSVASGTVAEGPIVGAPDGYGALRDALISTGGNIARTARRLNIPRTTLRYRISQQGLEMYLPQD